MPVTEGHRLRQRRPAAARQGYYRDKPRVVVRLKNPDGSDPGFAAIRPLDRTLADDAPRPELIDQITGIWRVREVISQGIGQELRRVGCEPECQQIFGFRPAPRMRRIQQVSDDLLALDPKSPESREPLTAHEA